MSSSASSSASSSSAASSDASSSAAAAASSTTALALVPVPNADRTQLTNYGTEAIRSGEVEVEVQWRHSSGAEIKFQNIVATTNLGTQLELKKIALYARNAEYNPKRFAAVIMRIREPKTTALIFQSGKMVCTGAKSEHQARQSSRKFTRIIQKLGFDNARFTEFKVQNMVGTCDVGFPIRLEGVVHQHARFSSYEPELFPGLIYRMGDPKIVLLIFVSGKIVLTGGKSRRDIYKAFDNIYPVLVQYKKQTQAPPSQRLLGNGSSSAAAPPLPLPPSTSASSAGAAAAGAGSAAGAASAPPPPGTADV